MCDFHLAMHMFLYVYVADPSNVAVKSWLAPRCCSKEDEHGGSN
jgi:hypothetical protein